MTSSLVQGSVIPLGFTGPRSGQTVKSVASWQAGGVMPTVYTAPATKSFYCTALCLSGNSNQSFDVIDDGTTVFSAYGLNGANIPMSGSVLFIVSPTKNLVVEWSNRGAGALGAWAFSGWEQ